MKLAHSERVALCDLLQAVGPDAPTLCEGWTTSHLAAHLWVRETDPVAAPGIAMKSLATVTDRRMGDVLSKYGYDELVAKIKAGPTPWSLFAIPGVDEAANALEYYIHHEDVRRANGRTERRELPADVEDFMWQRLKLMGRVFFRRAGVGVVLEDERDAESQIRALPGSDVVTLVGTPGELMLYTYGRGAAAQVREIGDDTALERLHSADMAL